MREKKANTAKKPTKISYHQKQESNSKQFTKDD